MSEPAWMEASRFTAYDIARWFNVPAHLVTYDLPAGYWRAEEARQIRRHSIRARLRRLWRRIA